MKWFFNTDQRKSIGGYLLLRPLMKILSKSIPTASATAEDQQDQELNN